MALLLLGYYLSCKSYQGTQKKMKKTAVKNTKNAREREKQKQKPKKTYKKKH